MPRLLFALILSSSLLSNIARAADCAPCNAVKNLEIEYFALNPLNSNDVARGDKALEEVVRLLVDFQDKAPRMREAKEYFASLVRLTAATVPYGGYAQGAEELITLMKENPRLRREYGRALQTVPLYCHRELLKYTVTSMDCTFAEMAAGTYETEGGQGQKSCQPPPFKFHDCLKAGARAPQAKPSKK